MLDEVSIRLTVLVASPRESPRAPSVFMMPTSPLSALVYPKRFSGGLVRSLVILTRRMSFFPTRQTPLTVNHQEHPLTGRISRQTAQTASDARCEEQVGARWRSVFGDVLFNALVAAKTYERVRHLAHERRG